MAGILEIKRGTISVGSLNDGEFYLNKASGVVQIGSGSSILTLLPLNKTITGDIILNGNVYANNLTGSAALSASLVTTLTVGGIEAGTTIPIATDLNSLFSNLLSAYQKPVLSGFFLRNNTNTLSTGSIDVGGEIEFNRVILTSSIESPGTYYAQSVSITASGTTTSYSSNLGNLSNQNNTITISPSVVRQRTTSGSVAFTINAVSSTGLNLNSLQIIFPFYFRNYLCASSTIITNNTTAVSVISSGIVVSELAGTKNWTVTCDSNNNSQKWTYLIYPYSYGELTQIAQGHTDVFGAFEKLTNTDTSTNAFTFNNPNSISSTYYIYKSNASGAFADGVKLTME